MKIGKNLEVLGMHHKILIRLKIKIKSKILNHKVLFKKISLYIH